jgi:hypothetical protein
MPSALDHQPRALAPGFLFSPRPGGVPGLVRAGGCRFESPVDGVGQPASGGPAITDLG